MYPLTNDDIHILSTYLVLSYQSLIGIRFRHSTFLRLVLAMVVSSVMTGVLTSLVGYYTPFLIIGVGFMVVGAGTLTTL